MIITVLIVCLMNFFMLKPMEEQIETALPPQDIGTKIINLELIDGDKLLYSRAIPYFFAEESSVIKNNLQFKEEEESQAPSVQLDSSTVTIDQMKALSEFLENYKKGNTKHHLSALSNKWYPNELYKFVDLINISNYLGNEAIVRYGIKTFYKIMDKLSNEHQWDLFFQLPPLFVYDLQILLGNKIKKNSVLNHLLNLVYKKRKKLRLKETQFSSYDITTGKNWLCAVESSLYDFLQRNSEDVGMMTVVDLKSLKPIQIFKTQETIFGSIKISPAEDLVLVTSGEVYSLQTGKKIAKISDNAIRLSCFSHDGKSIFAYKDQEIIILDAYTLQMKKSFAVNSRVQWLTSSDDGKFIAFTTYREIESLGNKNIVEVWEIENEKKYSEFIEGQKYINNLLFSPDSHHLACGFEDGKVKIFNLYGIPKLMELEVESANDNPSFVNLAFSQDSRLLAAGCDQREPKREISKVPVWDYKKSVIDAPVYKEIIRFRQGKVKALGFSPDGEKLACAYELAGVSFGTLFIFELMHSELLKKLSPQALILLWHSALHDATKTKQVLILPQGYKEAFLELPRKVQKYFYKKVLDAGQSPATLPFIPDLRKIKKPEEAIQYLKEKRKEPEKKEKSEEKEKKKSVHKRFKWD